MADEFGYECRIFSKRQNEYLYAADADPEDDSRRSVFTWMPGEADEMCTWKLIPATDDHSSERKFYIYNAYQNEYLYAAEYDPFDDDRRKVFTWRCGERDHMMVWRIEPTSKEGRYALYNCYHKEYLYASDNNLHDDKRRHTFTWRPKTRGGKEGHYIFEWLGENPLE